MFLSPSCTYSVANIAIYHAKGISPGTVVGFGVDVTAVLTTLPVLGVGEQIIDTFQHFTRPLGLQYRAIRWCTSVSGHEVQW